MGQDLTNLQGETRRNLREQTLESVNHLNACLTMVRPAWMSDEAAAEWLTIAASDLADIAPRTLAMAAKEARGKCTHHSQIVPAIRESQAVADERRFKALQWADNEARWERRKKQLADKSETQKLIESTAKGLRSSAAR